MDEDIEYYKEFFQGEDVEIYPAWMYDYDCKGSEFADAPCTYIDGVDFTKEEVERLYKAYVKIKGE